MKYLNHKKGKNTVARKVKRRTGWTKQLESYNPKPNTFRNSVIRYIIFCLTMLFMVFLLSIR